MRCLDHDQFSYLYDHGDHAVALVDGRSFHVDCGDELALGEGGGEEGTYTVRCVLPLERSVFAELGAPIWDRLVPDNNPSSGRPRTLT